MAFLTTKEQRNTDRLSEFDQVESFNNSQV
jgi:hypothetical protein